MPRRIEMRDHAFVAGAAARSVPSRLALSLLLAVAVSAPVLAQSFLGTIRGTVTDPQGAAVSGAAVLIVDEATGIPRAVDTDSEGRYEAVNLRPGTYRIEVTTAKFKKFERQGVVLRAASTALVDAKLELGAVTESVTVSAEALNNITLDSGSIARGLDEQQLHDLPRNSRDIQSFLLLNPNVLGGLRRHPVPGRPHVRGLVHPGRPGLDQRHLRHGRELGPRPGRDRRDPGPLQLLQRGVRRPRGRARDHQAGRQRLS